MVTSQLTITNIGTDQNLVFDLLTENVTMKQ